MVPKNMNHLLQPLDLTTNASVKKMDEYGSNGSDEESEYFTNTITKEKLRDPKRNVTTIEVDLQLSNSKLEHAKVMRKVYGFLKSEKGFDVTKTVWRADSITDVLKEARDTGSTLMKPFSL